MTRADTVAVVPVKNLATAKRRLKGVLGSGDRRRLSLAMLSNVLMTLKEVDILDAIAVISRDPGAIDLARTLRVRVLREMTTGLNAAVAEAARILSADGYSTLLVVPADVPLGTPAEVTLILQAQLDGSSVTLVPDRSGTGTNALACSPPGAIAPCFGESSLANHLNAAQRAGLASRVLPLSGLALDVDTPDDLVALMARLPRNGTHDALRSILRNG